MSQVHSELPRRFKVPIALVAVGLSYMTISPARGDDVREMQFWLHEYGIERAWSISQGAGAVVGVLDLRVDPEHPDLKGQVRESVTLPGADTRDTWHGTAVAGILAAHGHGPTGSEGMIGVAPRASLISGINAGSDVGAGIVWAVDHGATVINIAQALGSAQFCDAEAEGRQQQRNVAYAESHDVVIVAGAGNNDGLANSVGCPAAFPGVVAVTGVVKNGSIDTHNSAAGPQVAVAAASATTQQSKNSTTNGYLAPTSGRGDLLYDWFQGTSGATPIVAGVAALIRSRYPHMNAASVINRIIRTATDKGAPGRDDVYGYGIVNAYSALTKDIPDVTENPLGHVPGGEVPARSAASTRTEAQHGNEIGSSAAVITAAGAAAAAAVMTTAILAIRRDRRRRSVSSISRGRK
jgi:membrane-anchored mycosin MYCP